MKKILLIPFLLLFINVVSAQQDLALLGYRNIPQEEMKTFIQNEAMYWSKVAAVLKGKNQITGWAIHAKVGGGRASEANIMTRVAPGTWENYENLGKNYAAAEKQVREEMDPALWALLEDDLKQDKYNVASLLVQNASKGVWAKNSNWNYVVQNFVKATNPVNYLAEEERIMAPFFKKMIKQGGTKMKGWTTVTVLSPTGYDYSFNVFTVDFYENLSDVFNPFTSDSVEWPSEMASLGEMKTPGFWKRVVWKRAMYLDDNNNLVDNR
jgi:hypothetical protein